MANPQPTRNPPDNRPPISKLVRAREELLKTLSALPDGVRFNIIVFNDEVAAFSEFPATISPEILDKVEAYLHGLRAEGGTNLFDALNHAFRIKNMGIGDRFGEHIEFDTVFLLSDGVPSAGLVIDPDEIFRIVHEANRQTRIKINTIYIEREPSRFMFDLADRNFGKYVHIH